MKPAIDDVLATCAGGWSNCIFEKPFYPADFDPVLERHFGLAAS